MQIISFYTDSHEEIYNDYFLPSLRRVEPNMKVEGRRLPIVSDGSFMSEGFKQTLLVRLVEQVKAIDAAKANSLLLFTDVDIVFLRIFGGDLLRRMENLDVLYQTEIGNLVNGGFFVVRCCGATKRFYLNVLRSTIITPTGTFEQAATNRLLPISGLRYGLLPANLYSNYSNGGVQPESFLYHSTGTEARTNRSSVAIKRDVLDALVNLRAN